MFQTLEQLLLNRTPFPVLIILQVILGLSSAAIYSVIIFCIGILFFGINVYIADISAVLLPIILGTAALVGIGFIFSAFLLVYKKISGLTWILSVILVILGGIYFPVQMLPEWMQFLAEFVPTKHILDALRQAVLNHATVKEISHQLILLSIMLIILLPAGVISMNFAIKKTLKNSTLLHF